MAQRLRAGDIAGQIDRWERQEMMTRLERIDLRGEEIEAQNREILDALKAQAAADTFAQILARR